MVYYDSIVNIVNLKIIMQEMYDWDYFENPTAINKHQLISKDRLILVAFKDLETMNEFIKIYRVGKAVLTIQEINNEFDIKSR